MKKLIALLLVVAFACASSIGCGDTKSTATPPKGPGAGAPGDGGKKAP